MKTRTGSLRTWLAASLVAFSVVSLSTNASAEPQVRFSVPAPFRVAGHGFDAGVIAMRSVSPHTPTTAIFEVWVNGECLGLMTARRTVPEAPNPRTEAVFQRAGDGSLDMLGFQVAGLPNGTTYRFP